MPLLANAKKALRVSKRKNTVNTRIRSRVKTFSDAFKKQPTAANLSAVFSAIDRAVKKNIFHRNKGSRMKSQLSKLLVSQSK